MRGRPVSPSSPQASVVWRSGALALTTCPVRLITTDTRRAMRTFAMTHELVLGVGVAQFRLVRLPGPGTPGAQDARTMAELDFIRAEYNRAFLAAAKPRPAKAERKDRR